MIGNLPRCREAGAAMTDDKQVLDLEEPLDLNTMFLDTAGYLA
jgi:hypothetical protein